MRAETERPIAPSDARVALPRRPALDWTVLAAIATGLVAFLVFVRTAYRTVAFWDAGEFIATSAILGIPHQPSTPLYVLLGRLATFVPVGSVAFRVNLMSALAQAVAVAFAALATSRLARRAGLAPPAAALAAALAGLLLAFARTLWFNAIEAEVYALSNAIAAVGFWALLRWADSAREERDLRIPLAVFYVLSLSIGIHLGTYLVLPAFLVLFLRSRPPGIIAGRDLVLWLVGWPVAGAIATALCRSFAGPASFALGFAAAAVLVLLCVRDRKLGLSVLALFLLGVSVHLFLPIRSALDPMINEGEPDDWRRFFDTLSRAQYPPSNPFIRRAPAGVQFGDHFFDYLVAQWPLFRGTLGGLIPILGALAGAIVQARRDRRGFETMLAWALATGPGMIFYLNFTDHEVRERDYFFVLFFQGMAMWAGLSGGSLAQWIAARIRPAERARLAFAAAAAALLALALLPLKEGFRIHDRSRDTIARDYAWNLLVPLPKDAILFTNGDNDTFPLWYLQEVEGVRKDVRVVNLSLLNTPWYIGQLRDYAPKVPVGLTDEEIGRLRPMLDESGTQVLLVKDLAFRRILDQNAFRLPIYLAVTVPDKMGVGDRLVMEGLARRIHPTSQETRVDLETARRNAYEVFTPLHGILTAEGATDTAFYLDENERRLVQNYAAIHFYLAVEHERAGDFAAAIREAERARAISPGFSGNRILLGPLYERQGDFARAEALYRETLARNPGDFRVKERLGWVLAEQGRPAEGLPMLKEAVARAPRDDFGPPAALFEVYWSMGARDSALAVLDAWLATHPADVEVREIRDRAARGELNLPPRPAPADSN